MSSIFSFLESVSQLEWAVATCVIFIPAFVFVCWRLISRSFYFADWWARHIKMRGWKLKKPGDLKELPNGKVSLSAPEVELCKYYKNFARATDEYTFINANEWLKLSGQNEKKPMGLLVWLLLFVLTVGEALGTGFVVAPFISTEMTTNLVFPVGVTVAIVVSFGLLAVTHFAGAEATFAENYWDNIGSSSKSEIFKQKKITPGDDYRIDDEIDEKYRFVNRALKGGAQKPGKGARIFALVCLLLVMAGIFALRWKQHETIYLNGLQELPASSTSCGSNASAGNSSNPFAGMNDAGSNNLPGFSAGTQSPSSVNCNAATTQDDVGKKILFSSEETADIASFLLAFFYVVIQSIGFLFSKKYSFFGSGKEAYNITGGYINYSELKRDRLDPVYEQADNALHILRGHLQTGFTEYENYPSNMTFKDYVFDSKISDAMRESDEKSPELDKQASKNYYDSLQYSDGGLDIIRGVKALEKAIAYRKTMREQVKSMQNIGPYPISLEDYVGYMEAMRHNSSLAAEKTKYVARQTPVVQGAALEGTAFVSVQAPVVEPAKPLQPNQALGNKTLLAQYDVFDIEAAEEMLKAGSLKERKQILEELSEGSEEKKALIQEIYSKMKAV